MFILNVKDTEAPKMVLTDLGLELNDFYSTSGNNTVIIDPNSYLILESGFGTQGVAFNYETCGDNAYLIINNIVVEFGTVINGTDSLCYFTFDNHNVGNGVLEWNPSSEIGISKEFHLDCNFYDITLINSYPLEFIINEKEPDEDVLVDEFGNCIVDEFGNIIIG